LRRHVEHAALQIEQQLAPIERALAGAIVEPDKFLGALRRRANDDEDALLLVFEVRLEMDAIRPLIDVSLRRQITLLPGRVLVELAIFQATDGRYRQPRSILAEQCGQRLGEVAGRDPLQVKQRPQRLDRLHAPHVGRQDLRPEPDAVGGGTACLAITHTRLANGNRTDACHHLALRQMTVAHEALVAVTGLQIDMLAEKVCDLCLDRLGKQRTRPVAQDVGERIVEGFWLL
jgi:hypothetical protein